NFGGYFTYALSSPTRLTLTAFDSSHAVLGAAVSPFFNDQGLSGDPGSAANEFLQLSFDNISFVTIAGDPGGSSFTADDLTYTASPTAVPEPSTLILVAAGCGALIRYRFKARGGCG